MPNAFPYSPCTQLAYKRLLETFIVLFYKSYSKDRLVKVKSHGSFVLLPSPGGSFGGKTKACKVLAASLTAVKGSTGKPPTCVLLNPKSVKIDQVI